MNKPLTFEEFWSGSISELSSENKSIMHDFQPLFKQTWNTALLQATKIVNATEDRTLFPDFCCDVLIDVAAEIESLAAE